MSAEHARLLLELVGYRGQLVGLSRPPARTVAAPRARRALPTAAPPRPCLSRIAHRIDLSTRVPVSV
jgi:hypothetical protein